MRLINTRTQHFQTFFEEQRPPYAILSHTWGSSDDEASLQDLEKVHELDRNHSSVQRITSRPGYGKILNCCAQALSDGYDWAWIDTCCIDKTSSAELSEDINSMFRWYRDSEVCYVLLSDVHDAAEDVSPPNSPFRKSRWFTRGWTLQELLAPRRLLFFSSKWAAIDQLPGNSAFHRVVSEITQIPEAFLLGSDVQAASVAQRMSWASSRTTTRGEDIAYSLLGLFDVNMPLLYGEGSKAFIRLQEEILKQNNDQTLLAWGLLPHCRDYSPTTSDPCSVLAQSPANFASCGNMINRRLKREYMVEKSSTFSFTITNQGLRMKLPLLNNYFWPTNAPLLCVLDCIEANEPLQLVTIPLEVSMRHFFNPLTFLHNRVGSVKDGDVVTRKNKSLILRERGFLWMLGDIRQKASRLIYIRSDTNLPSPWVQCAELFSIVLPPGFGFEVLFIDSPLRIINNLNAESSNHLTVSCPDRRAVIGTPPRYPWLLCLRLTEIRTGSEPRAPRNFLVHARFWHRSSGFLFAQSYSNYILHPFFCLCHNVSLPSLVTYESVLALPIQEKIKLLDATFSFSIKWGDILLYAHGRPLRITIKSSTKANTSVCKSVGCTEVLCG